MSKAIPLDAIDHKIIETLGIDARVSNREIGRALGLTEGTIRTRLKRLLDNRVIQVAAITNTVFYANPNPASLEFVDEAVKSNPSIYPTAETLANAFTMKAHSPDFEEVLTRTWTRIKTGQ